jgi:hypothetical protein
MMMSRNGESHTVRASDTKPAANDAERVAPRRLPGSPMAIALGESNIKFFRQRDSIRAGCVPVALLPLGQSPRT